MMSVLFGEGRLAKFARALRDVRKYVAAALRGGVLGVPARLVRHRGQRTHYRESE